jgi:GAF domain-containing protein
MNAPAALPTFGLPKEVLSGWQSAVDVLAVMLKVPVGVLTRIRDQELEVLASSKGKTNPFLVGERTILLDSGLYCEEVIRTRSVLRVKDGRKDAAWKRSPPVQDGWISHFGYPLFQPGGHVFGTLCLLDRKPREFSDTHGALLRQVGDLVEAQIHLLILDRKQRERAQLLETYREELRQLRGTFPLCPSCKKIRNDPDYWEAVEEYFVTHAMGEFGHGLCPSCSEEHWGETVLEPEPVPLPRGLGAAGTVRA